LYVNKDKLNITNKRQYFSLLHQHEPNNEILLLINETIERNCYFTFNIMHNGTKC
jgi:hypothetical protein